MIISEKELRRIIKEACWKGYKQVGMKEKGGKQVPNCVPIDETIEEEEAPEDVSEALLYHIDRNAGVDKNIFRPGSIEFFNLFREVRALSKSGDYTLSSAEYELIRDTDIGRFAIYEGQIVPLDYPMLYEDQIQEAEYKGRKVKLNKPKRGSGGKAYVYVNSGKKDKKGRIKVKKVTFGSSMPDAMGSSDAAKERRKSFGRRHKCSEKNDKTKPGYWSCRATKFFGRNISGWW